ncbi:lipid A deacylase LpxR family protein [Thioalkalivibrio sulfidiphilus]|uniref:lipid A deacylase LpxR family protein n=1 Tax=Thioalkalivibrio sulfidiphilus TaxID=1033854 RepID=UPI000375A2F6|nr:lipid A deacylase LpxR family protein [Thioalkalivibrio sulfidiphilus]
MSRFLKAIPAVLLTLLLLPVTPATARDLPAWLPEIPETPERGILVLEYENDLFAGEDRYYTSGVRASWITPGSGVPGLLRDVGELIPFFPGQGELKASWSIGQSMYTPKDIEEANPSPGDRPYAGWLYVSGGLAEETGDRLDRLQLTLGVVGPASLAEQTQKTIHEFMGSPIPQGWDHQLGNELTLMVSYERQWRSRVRTAEEGWRIDLTPHWGGTLGTPFTLVNTGLTLRAGRDLPHDYGPPRIQPALPGSGLFVPRSRWGWYLFAGVDARAVAWNTFLDGNLWRDSPSVDRHVFVGDAQLGAVLGLGRARLAYTHVFRTPEFRNQVGRDDFGALSLSWIF